MTCYVIQYVQLINRKRSQNELLFLKLQKSLTLCILDPIILYAKLIMQDLWQYKLEHDIILPTIHCMEFTIQLNSINELIIERWVVLLSYTNVQIHGFCDVNIKDYSACLYIRLINKHNAQCRLLCAKS